MKKQRTGIRLSCILPGLLFAAGLVGSAKAGLIYSHSFSGDGTGVLTGTAPDTAPGSEVWLGVDTALVAQWRNDGTIIETNNVRRNVFLPFTPESGKVYTLKIDVERIGTLNQFQFGFVQNANGTGGFPLVNDNVGASPWMNFAAINGNVTTFIGPTTNGTSAQISGQNPDVMNTLQMVLNTEDTAWTVEWSINGTSVRTETFATNPTINYVGFGRYNQGTFTVDNFELSVIPEPVSVGLIGIGGLALLAARRIARS